MKKIAFCIMATGLSLTFHPLQSSAVTIVPSTSVPVSKAAEAAEAKNLLLRLDKINAMDKSNLKLSDKKNLLKEVRTIDKRLKEIGGGVYISAGAIIIILILILIFL